MLDPRDLALQSACPVLAAPRFGCLPEMDNGQRIVVAANGLFVQVKLDWLDCLLRIAPLPAAPPLPYGRLEERIVFAFGVIPIPLLERFIDAGRAGLPNEVAGGLIYSRRSASLRLQVYEAQSASGDGIVYRMPELAADESIAVDLHTHGHAPAFWSRVDNADDQGIKIAGVFGHLHQERPSAAFRLAINGHFHPLSHPWERHETPLEAHGHRSILEWLAWAVGR